MAITKHPPLPHGKASVTKRNTENFGELKTREKKRRGGGKDGRFVLVWWGEVREKASDKYKSEAIQAHTICMFVDKMLLV